MEFLFILLIVLVFTRVMGEIASRFNQPELIGNLLAGILLGIIITHLGDNFHGLKSLTTNEAFIAITELGVFFLMLTAGLEMHPKELMESTGRALIIALSGLLVPFLAGVSLAAFYIPDSDWKLAQCIFIGTALAITAIPVAAKVLMETGELKSTVGKTIMSAALFDDVLGLVLLAILTALISSGTGLSIQNFALLGLHVALFFALVVFLGQYVIPWLLRVINYSLTDEIELSLLLIVGLTFSLIAELLDLHFILGAFIAGLFFTRRNFGTKVYNDVSKKVNAISIGFFAPIFFASIGLHLELSAIVNMPVFVALLIILAILSKFVGAGLAALLLGMERTEAASIGIGMSARGAVELIIAEIALRAGLFEHPEPVPLVIDYMYSSIVLMAIVTTLVMPIGFRYFLNKAG